MKKFLRLMTAGALALVMILSLVSCGLFNSMEMKDVEKAMKNLAKEEEDTYVVAEVSKDQKKALTAAIETLFEIKGGIEGMAQINNIEDEDYPWCMAVEFEKASDAKKVAKNLEDSIEDLMIEMSVASMQAYYEELGMDSSEIKAAIKELKAEMKEEIDDAIPDDFAVVRKGNIVFCGSEDLIETVIEAVEDAKK